MFLVSISAIFTSIYFTQQIVFLTDSSALLQRCELAGAGRTIFLNVTHHGIYYNY